MANYDDPCSLNKTTKYTGYNCYGFAFGTLEWEEPNTFDHRFENNGERIDSCVEEILTAHRDWRVIESYKGLPENVDVVGFRIGETAEPIYAYQDVTEDGVTRKRYKDTGETEEGHADFHFVLRHNCKWYHKPGSWEIEEIEYNIDEVWPHHDRPYNSRITWFVKTA